jgi:hypothetical protein
MKKVYFTVDIEPIVSRVSFNPTILNNVILGSIYIAKEMRERNLKATFFVSLSPKTPKISFKEYNIYVKTLIQILKPFDNIRIEPHLHVLGIPMPFNTQNDQFSAYDLNQAIQLLCWAKDDLISIGLNPVAFRPGGFKQSGGYYEALKKAGFKFSSTLNIEKPVFSLIKGELNQVKILQDPSGITEYPVTGVEIKSIKGRREVINLSPDFFTLDSIKDYLHKLDYININFHSFSIYANRFARENHEGQLKNNLKYLFLEKPLNSILSKFRLELINKETLFRNEFIKWIDFLKDNNYKTYFIGE